MSTQNLLNLKIHKLSEDSYKELQENDNLDTTAIYLVPDAPNTLSIQLNSGVATVFDGSTSETINITPSAIGAAAESHGTHVTTETVKSALSTSSTGTKVLKEDGTWTALKQDGITGTTVNRFGTCSTTAAIAAKMVDITSGDFTLEKGARVTVQFTYANSASNPTLSVNGTGAKSIYHKGSQITTGTNKTLLAGVCDFVYDGTRWHLVGNYVDNNTTLSGVAYCITKASAADKTATMPGFALSSGQYILLRTTVTNSATSSVTLDVNSTGAKTVKIGTAAVSASNFPAGDYLANYDGTNWVLTRIYLTDTNTDTKNTAGSTNTSSKIYLIGATSQAANPQTYSHDTAYVGTDGCLYSGGFKVLTAHPTITKSDDTTSTATLSHSGTFTAIDSVTRDSNGHVTTINTKTYTLPASGNTDTKVTSASNHYTPTSDTNSALYVDASSSTAASWNSTSLVTGVNLQRDAKGHVTGVTVDSVKMPANPDTNTTYTFATGSTNGTFTYTPSGRSATAVTIKGFESGNIRLGTSNSIEAGSFIATSDKRLKENITEYKAEKSILDLPVYKYNFIADEAKKEHIGCLAQDLQEICPEIVSEKEDGYLAINENKIVYLLLEEVKKLKQEVANLKTGGH